MPTMTHNPSTAVLNAYKQRAAEIMGHADDGRYFPRWRTYEPTLYLEASSGTRIFTCNTETGEMTLTRSGHLAEQYGEHHDLTGDPIERVSTADLTYHAPTRMFSIEASTLGLGDPPRQIALVSHRTGRQVTVEHRETERDGGEVCGWIYETAPSTNRNGATNEPIRLRIFND